ncbi:MAG: glycosyl hydrolase family 18 protein [Ilumatobacteraceae bacterium]
MPDADDPGAAATDRARSKVRQRLGLAVLTLIVVAVAVGGVLIATREPPPPPPKPDIPLDAWAPYWTLDASIPEADRRLGSLRDVSPFWFSAVGVNEIVVDPSASPELTEEFLDKARSSTANVVPSIVDAMPAGGMAAILADPATRAQHVEAIAAFASDGDYAGIDIDYEQFAFADGRETWASTRPNWVAFITELGAALHADGRTLSVSIPPVYDAGQTLDSGYWVYDYGGIAPHVDTIRIMAYDFSVDEAGPIAPLAWVESTITGAIEAVGSPDKLVLGIPAYGRNWPTFVSGTCPADAEGRTSLTTLTVDDLIARRSATPVYVEETGEWFFEYNLEVTDGVTTCTQTRQVHYVDGNGVRARMDLARQYQLNGVSLWALGFDDEGVWDAILPTVTDPSATTTVL